MLQLERLRATLAADIQTLRSAALQMRHAGLTGWAEMLDSEADVYQGTLDRLTKA